MKRLCALLAGCAFLSSPAAAQPRPDGPRPAAGSPEEAHAFAFCIADDWAGTLVLEMLPGTMRESEFVDSTTRLRGWSCRPANRVPVVGPPFMRGVAAEYLLETGATRPSISRRVFPMPSNEALERLGADTRAGIVLIQIGECAARADLPGVMALLATSVGSSQERAALRALVPAISGCVPQGISFQLAPMLVRGYLAEGAYRNSGVERSQHAR